MDTKSGRRFPLNTIYVMAVAALVLNFHARYSLGQNQQLQDPHSPAYGHPYRHGVVPTLEAWQEMRACGFSIGLSSNASFCPPPGAGDECSENDPLYATD